MKFLPFNRPLLVLLALLLLSACAAQPTTTPTPETAAPTTEAETPSSQDAAITQAVNAWLEANAPTLAGNVTITVEASEGGFARVQVVPNDPTATDPAIAYLQEQGGQWTLLSLGTAFGPDFYAEFGIPQGLQLGEPLPDETTASYQPLPAEACAALEQLAEETLGQAATVAEAPFADAISGATGAGCQVTLTGTGEQFGDFLTVTQQLTAALTAQGWQEDTSYLADGPTGAATAFRQDNRLVLVAAGWQPGPAVSCPADQPISACEVPPAQQIFTITLNAAQS